MIDMTCNIFSSWSWLSKIKCTYVHLQCYLQASLAKMNVKQFIFSLKYSLAPVQSSISRSRGKDCEHYFW